jgi:hypothetical protein
MASLDFLNYDCEVSNGPPQFGILDLEFASLSFTHLLAPLQPTLRYTKNSPNSLIIFGNECILGFASFVTSYLEKSLFENYIGLLAGLLLVYEYRPLDLTQVDSMLRRRDAMGFTIYQQRLMMIMIDQWVVLISHWIDYWAAYYL